jgi:DNA-directed RNA polymerase
MLRKLRGLLLIRRRGSLSPSPSLLFVLFINKTNDWNIKSSEEQPAFIHTYEYQRGKKLGVIKLNPVVTERLSQDSLDKTLHPRHLPMLVQPRPWLSHKEGGYLYNKSEFLQNSVALLIIHYLLKNIGNVMRIKDSNEQLSYLTKASSEGHLELVFSGLDVLGGTPWQINRDVFKVVLEVWNSGAELGRIPPVSLDLEEPEKPENFDTDQKAKLVYLVKLQDVLNARRNNHSERCSVNYKMEIARAVSSSMTRFRCVWRRGRLTTFAFYSS